MKQGWRRVKLGDLCTRITDGSHNPPKGIAHSNYLMLSSRNVIDDRIILDNPRYLRKSDFEAESRRTDVREGDVLLTIVGTVGRVAVVSEELPQFTLQRSVAVLKSRREVVTPRFLMRALQSIVPEINKEARGVAQKGIYLGQLERLEIFIPPIPEQHRIVAILDEAFAGIATATANAKRNLNNARELFESDLRSIFTAKGEAADWAAKSFSEVMEISSVLVDPRDGQYLEMLHVGGGNIESKTGRLVDLKTAREEGLISGKFVFDETMVLYSKIRPYLMKVARPDFKGLCSADIYPLSVKMGKLDRNFLYYLLLSPAFTEYAIAGSARAGMPKVNRDHLFAYRCQLPSLAKQMEYAAKLDELSAETQKLESIYQQKHTALNELKQSVLHQAFSGQLH